MMKEEKDLIELKNILAKHFADKAIKEAYKIWNEKGLNNNKMDEWLSE